MHSRVAPKKANATKANKQMKKVAVPKRKLSTKKVVKKTTTTISTPMTSISSVSTIKKSAPFTMTHFARNMSTLNTPGNILFTRDHEYIRFDSPTTAFVGITRHAQELLGDIVYFDAPAVGQETPKDHSFGAIESVKSSSDIYAPASLKVLKLNPKLESQLELINTDAHGEGWLIHAEMVDSGDFESLMNKEQYTKYLETLDH